MESLPIKFENDGIQLWYGAQDTPAPSGAVSIPKTGEIGITIGVSPVSPNNLVKVNYRVNGGRRQSIKAKYIPNLQSADAQYFQASIKGLKPGDEVEYRALCQNMKKVVPSPGEEKHVSFKVAKQGISRSPTSVFKAPKIVKDPVKPPPPVPAPPPAKEPPAAKLPKESPVDKIPQPTPTDEDPCKPKREVEEPRKPREFVVYGAIRYKDKPVQCVVVTAFDKDMRSEQLLGEAVTDAEGNYLIHYTDTSFQRVEKKNPDLVVRAYHEDGLRVESGVIFNAEEKQRVDLSLEVIEQKPEPEPEPALTEYERYIEELEPLMEGVPFADLTFEDIKFLSLETDLTALYISFLNLSFQHARESDLPEAAFYGWYRQGLKFETLSELLNYRIARLLKELEIAIMEHIIPELNLGEIREILSSLRFELGILADSTFLGQLIDSKSKFPLDDFIITATDTEAEESEDKMLGETASDAQGMFSFVCPLPGNAAEDYEKPVQLVIKNEEGEIALETEVKVKVQQDEVHQIEIDLGALPDTSTVIDKKLASPELLRRFKKVGIITINDALQNPVALDELEKEFPENEQLHNIISHTDWSVLTDDFEKRQLLIDAGYPSIYDVTETSRAEFVSKMHDKLGDVGATELYLQAETVSFRVSQVVTNLRLATANGGKMEEARGSAMRVDMSLLEKLNYVFNYKCTCKDCESGVSPLAYLADLLKWIRKNVNRNGSGSPVVSIRHLESTFYQDFGSLPASCESMNKKYRQVRICVDVLRRFLIANQPSGTSTDSIFQAKYNSYVEDVYRFLLNQVGVSFEELRLAQPAGETYTAEELNAPSRQRLAQRLGIDVENLIPFFLPNPSGLANRLFSLFGYYKLDDPYEEKDMPQLLEWQFAHLREIWAEQDRPFGAYGPDGTIPIIDPTIITEDYFRAPHPSDEGLRVHPIPGVPIWEPGDAPGKNAFDFFQERLEILNEYRAQILSELETGDIKAIISKRLERQVGLTHRKYQEIEKIPFSDLWKWKKSLPSGQDISEALENIAAIPLTVEHFTRLMDLAGQARDSETREEIANILTYVEKFRHFEEWVKEEKELVEQNEGITRTNIIFDSNTFWLPIRKTTPEVWLASEADLEAWVNAYNNYNSLPIIEPDQLSSADFNLDFSLDEYPAYELWSDRLEWCEQRLTEINTAITEVDTDKQKLQAALKTSETGISLAEIIAVDNQMRSGHDIRPRLRQLGLDYAMLQFITHLRKVISDGYEVDNDQWEELAAILVQVEKSRRYASWKLEERRVGIVLSDEYFAVNPNLPETPVGIQKWLKNVAAYIEWQRTLEARIEQKRALKEALQEAVGKTEEIHLPRLRDAYIERISKLPGMPRGRAAWLQSRLLNNTRMSGCQMTTRASEAISALQTFVWEIHTESLKETNVEEGTESFDYSITTDFFEEEWKWIGSYASWRSAMFVNFYPENVCQPQLQKSKFQSFGFKRLLRRLPRFLTPEKACELIKEYGDYFDDIKQLRVQAVCYASTYSNERDNFYQEKEKSHHVFLFSLAESTGNVYWCKFKNNNISSDNLIWKPVNQYINEFVIEVLAAITFPKSETHIALFVKVRGTDSEKLRVVFYNLNTSTWGGEKGLGLPPGISGKFKVKAGQRSDNFNDRIPFAFLTGNGRLFLRNYALKERAWAGDNWPLHYWFNSRTEKKWKITKLCAILQFDEENGGYYNVLICQFEKQNGEKNIKYRIPDRYNEGWYDIARGEFLWAFTNLPEWPVTNVFYSDGLHGKTRMVSLNIPDKGYQASEDEVKNNLDRLINYDKVAKKILEATGVNLKDLPFSFSFSSKEFKVSHSVYSGDSISNELKEKKEDFKEWIESHQPSSSYSGTLGDFLFKTTSSVFLSTFLQFFPKEAEDFELHEKLKKYLGFQIIEFGIKKIKSYYESNNVSDSVKQKFNLITDYLKTYTLIHPQDKTKDWIDRKGFWGFSFLDSPIGSGDRMGPINEEKANSSSYIPANYGIAGIFKKILWEEYFFGVENYSEDTSKKTSSYVISFYCAIYLFKRKFDPVEPRFVYDFPIKFPHSAFFYREFMPYAKHQYYLITELYSSRQAWITTLFIEGHLEFSKRLSFYYDRTPYLELMPHGLKSHEIKQDEITDYYFSTQRSSTSNIRFMQEAFRAVPEQIALQLQKNGFYENALEFFKNIYDYTKPEGNRKIDFWLVHELSEDFDFDFNRSDSWWRDPLNPHQIASNRKGTYTRHILILIIHCLIEYADNEFSRDSLESNARAQKLYQQALKLLRSQVLNFHPNTCGDFLGELKIIVEESPKSQMELFNLNTPAGLQQVKNELSEINFNNLSKVQKFELTKKVIQSTTPKEESPQTIGNIVASDKEDFRKIGRVINAEPIAKQVIRKATKNRPAVFLNHLSAITETPLGELKKSENSFPLLRARKKVEVTDDITTITSSMRPTTPSGKGSKSDMAITSDIFGENDGENNYFNKEISFQFCVPSNPVLKTLYNTARNNLDKLNNCMNIAGIRRDLEPFAAPTDTETGVPFMGLGGQLITPGRLHINQKPTLYRYPVLIERAKQLAQMANQVEQAMLSALVNLDDAAYTLLRARQELELAEAGVQLQNLRVAEAEGGIGLAKLQRGQSEIRFSHFNGLLSQGLLTNERKALDQMTHAKNLQRAASAAYYSAYASQQISVFNRIKEGFWGSQAQAFSLLGSALSASAGVASTNASIFSTKASYERRAQDWQLQQNLAEWDIKIGGQQVALAQQRVGVVQQEKAIAELQLGHANEVLQFLANKFTNADLYDWMSKVLQEVYLYFLQQATAMARLAENQIAFERQEYPPSIIQSDYRNLPLRPSVEGKEDRYGLTGSFRLLRDITELDQYAFLNDQRKQLAVKTFSLAQLFPIEFQGLREDGVIVFSFNQEMFDWDFPGQYLRLIKRIRVSVIALIPPTEGIKATLTNAGISRTVIKGDTFQSTVIRRDPEVLVLSGSPVDNTGFFELQPESAMYLPFENSGVETSFEFRMPKPSNHFDFSSLADVLITVEFNSLYDLNYRQQATQKLGRDFSADRTLSFRYELSDQWYDLHHPEYSDTPMQVSFRTRREDFPSNLTAIRIQHLVMYFVHPEEAQPVSVTHFHFTPEGGIAPLGGSATTIDGLISTRAGNASSWIPIIGQTPFGTWELNLSLLEAGEENSLEEMEIRRRFRDGEIEDILFVITYEGVLPAW